MNAAPGEELPEKGEDAAAALQIDAHLLRHSIEALLSDGMSHEDKLQVWVTLTRQLGATKKATDTLSNILQAVQPTQIAEQPTEPLEACLPGTSIRISPEAVAALTHTAGRLLRSALAPADKTSHIS